MEMISDFRTSVSQAGQELRKADAAKPGQLTKRLSGDHPFTEIQLKLLHNIGIPSNSSGVTRRPSDDELNIVDKVIHFLHEYQNYWSRGSQPLREDLKKHSEAILKDAQLTQVQGGINISTPASEGRSVASLPNMGKGSNGTFNTVTFYPRDIAKTDALKGDKLRGMDEPGYLVRFHRDEIGPSKLPESFWQKLDAKVADLKLAT